MLCFLETSQNLKSYHWFRFVTYMPFPQLLETMHQLLVFSPAGSKEHIELRTRYLHNVPVFIKSSKLKITNLLKHIKSLLKPFYALSFLKLDISMMWLTDKNEGRTNNLFRFGMLEWISFVQLEKDRLESSSIFLHGLGK